MTILRLPMLSLQNDLLTVREVAGYFKLNPTTVVRWCNTGYLPAAKLGKAWRIRRNDLEQWIAQRRGTEWRA